MKKDYKITCTSIDCPERKSKCCGGISTPNISEFADERENDPFVCSECQQPFEGGKCEGETVF